MKVTVVLNGQKTLKDSQAVVVAPDFDDFLENARMKFNIPLSVSVRLFQLTGEMVSSVEDVGEKKILVLCIGDQEFIPAPEISEEIRREKEGYVLSLLSQVKEGVSEFQTAIEVIDLAIKSLDDKLVVAKESITKYFDGLVAALYQRRDELIIEAEDVKNKKREKLLSQKKDIVGKLGTPKQYSLLESRIKSGAEKDLSSVQIQLLRVKEMLSRGSFSLSPCEDDSIVPAFSTDIIGTIKSIGTIEWNESIEPIQLSPETVQTKHRIQQTFRNVVVDIEGGDFHTTPITISPSSLDTNIADYGYQWYRQESPDVFNAIPGATFFSFQPTINDILLGLRVGITPILMSGTRGRTFNVDIPTSMLALDPEVSRPVEENVQHGQCIFDIFSKRTSMKEAEERSIWLSSDGIMIKKNEELLNRYDYGTHLRFILPVNDPNTVIIHFDLRTVEEFICPSHKYRDILALTGRSYNAINQLHKGSATSAQFRSVDEYKTNRR